jgi:hypothetical protein
MRHLPLLLAAPVLLAATVACKKPEPPPAKVPPPASADEAPDPAHAECQRQVEAWVACRQAKLETSTLDERSQKMVKTSLRAFKTGAKSRVHCPKIKANLKVEDGCTP